MAFASRKMTEDQENIPELLAILSQISLKPTDLSRENADYPDGGEFLVRLTFPTGETFTIHFCGYLTLERDPVLYELKGDYTKLWEVCTAAKEEVPWEVVPDLSLAK